MVPPRDSKPKRPEFSDSEIAEAKARNDFLDKLVLDAKVDEILAARRKTVLDFVKGTANFIAALGVVFVFGRGVLDWIWAWARPFIKSIFMGP